MRCASRDAGSRCRKSLPIGEHIYGLGDKTGPLDRRGGTFVDWNTDAFGFAPSSDPIYKSIPFYIGIGRGRRQLRPVPRQQLARGFDFGHRDAAAIEISAPDGPIDYYVIAGPTMREVVRRYTDLTGKPPMPPLWALGYQQSRWGYKSDADVRGIAAGCARDRIPADVIWMDIDYQDRDRPFTVNTKAFPNLRKLNSDMGAKGIRLVAITDLHVAYLPNQGYAPLRQRHWLGDHFVRKRRRQPVRRSGVARTVGVPRLHARFDAGMVGRPVQGFHRRRLLRILERHERAGGVRDSDQDDAARQSSPDRERRLRARATRPIPRFTTSTGCRIRAAPSRGCERLRPGVRPFVMTRASYAGGQRYAVDMDRRQ